MAGKIVLTGGAGFIGTHLAEALAERTEIVLFDNLRRDSLALAPQLKSHPRVGFIGGDTLDAAAVEAALAGAEAVIHLAAIAGVSSYYAEPLTTLRVNLLGTVNVLEAAVHAGIRQFLYFSTSEVYGANARGVRESDACGIGPPTDRRWVYATSKLAGEQLTLRYGEEHGFAATVVRPFNVYGPRQVGEGAISNFCRAAAAGEPLTVYGDGRAVRAWCYISDLVAAVMSMLDHPTAGGEVFNIGNPDAVETTTGLAKRLAKLAPGLPIKHQDVQRDEVYERVPVIEHAQRVLGWQPRVGLDDGLALTLRWFQGAKAAAS